MHFRSLNLILSLLLQILVDGSRICSDIDGAVTLTYNRGGLQQIIAKDGAKTLLTRFGATVVRHSMQGAFKFGGYKSSTTCAIDSLGSEAASKNRSTAYLTSFATAESFLGRHRNILIRSCPYQTSLCTDLCSGTHGGFYQIARQEGSREIYAGLRPVLLQQ